MIKAVIFDLDGTLLNTIIDMNNSVNDTYEFFGFEKRNTVSETMTMVGHGMRNLMNKCFAGQDEEFIEKALTKFLKIYGEQYYKETKPYEGVVELINCLINKGIKVGVNSNKTDEYTKHLIELNFPKIDQNYVTGIRPGDNVKPDPKNVNELIQKMHIDKSEILYVGDSPTDLKTAANAGLKFVAVTWGFRSKEQLIEAGAKEYINQAEELKKYLDQK